MYYKVAIDDALIEKKFWRKYGAIFFAKWHVALPRATTATVFGFRRDGSLGGTFVITADDI